MMKFVKIDVETPLMLAEDYVRTLRIENADCFYRTVLEFSDCFSGKENSVTFWKDHKMGSPSKCGEMIIDLFHLDLNDRKVLSLLYKRIEEEFHQRDDILRFQEINGLVQNFLNDLIFPLPFPVVSEELALADLLKLSDVKIQYEYGSFLEKIICYINLFIELKRCEYFIFVNLKRVLTDKQLEELFLHCRREKVCLFLLESGRGDSLPFEKTVVITEDLCELLENQQET